MKICFAFIALAHTNEVMLIFIWITTSFIFGFTLQCKTELHVVIASAGATVHMLT